MTAAPWVASSETMALPTGWVAPVTMQTKPYCFGQLAGLVGRWEVQGPTSLPSGLYGEKCSLSDSLCPFAAAIIIYLLSYRAQLWYQLLRCIKAARRM